MTLDFIPHYYCRIDPVEMLVLAVVLGIAIICWIICMYVDRSK